MISPPPDLPPDVKDWTWVLRETCPQCGFDAQAVARGDIPDLVERAVRSLRDALGRPGAAERPQPGSWSPLEYACHVRDVCRVFLMRLDLMLTQDHPSFDNWDQDGTARDQLYWAQDLDTVATELDEAGTRIAREFAAVDRDEWQRPGRRSNGSVFTVDTLGRYFLHDLIHHAADVG